MHCDLQPANREAMIDSHAHDYDCLLPLGLQVRHIGWYHIICLFPTTVPLSERYCTLLSVSPQSGCAQSRHRTWVSCTISRSSERGAYRLKQSILLTAYFSRPVPSLQKYLVFSEYAGFCGFQSARQLAHCTARCCASSPASVRWGPPLHSPPLTGLHAAQTVLPLLYSASTHPTPHFHFVRACVEWSSE